jgi:four helix bundle protein
MSHELVLCVLSTFEKLPKNDVIRVQIERASLSITSNIAEGFGRQTLNDKKHFCVMARGSAFEVQNQLLVARDSHRISGAEFQRLAALSLDSVRLIHGLIRSIERKRNANS